MNYLKELPPGTVWPHLLKAIGDAALADLREYADSRAGDVARGAETPELAALLVDKYCEGMAKGLLIVGVDAPIRQEGDRLARALDLHFDANRQARWASRPAGLSMSSAE